LLPRLKNKMDRAQEASGVIVLGRHRPLAGDAWNELAVRAVIEEIAADAIAHFDPGTFWPAHPGDDGVADGNPSFYWGAAGVIWALDYLHRIGAVSVTEDFRPVLPRLLERTVAAFESLSPTDYAKHGSFLFGDMGAALVAMRVAPTPVLADLVHTPRRSKYGIADPGADVGHARIHAGRNPHGRDDRGNAMARPVRNAGGPAVGRSGGDAARPTLDTRSLWCQRPLARARVHGFAGNVIPLLRGWDWLTPVQQAQVAEFVPKALAANAWRSEVGTTWGARSKRETPPKMCQHCHGAPGMVTTFADAPFATPEFDALLVDAGRFTWTAGPLTKGSNLCHGTGGNGYAFLKLYRRTNDPVWLDRARQFAMTAIVQYRGAQMAVGRGRYSLWTGDVGLAIYLWDCITEEPRFPTIDVF
jgi:hypothetical protein